MSRITILFLGIVCIFSSGCLLGEGPDPEGEDLGFAQQALVDSNALNLNALNLNALNLNALHLNALNLNALSAGAAATLADPHNNGPLARQLLKYLVECAFSPGQTFELTWTDDLGDVHDETYAGILGLAPNWATGAPSNSDQKWVSACLLSRVNWYGTPVMLSSRASHDALDSTSWAETIAFPELEGAFWGNLFSDSPYAHACYDHQNRDHSREKSRDCAAGHVIGQSIVECGIIKIEGSCKNRCGSLKSSGGYFASCDVGNGEKDEHRVITVWLKP